LQKTTQMRFKKNKYGAKRSAGFHSRGEHKRFLELETLQKYNIIAELEKQKKYTFELNGVYITSYTCDFFYYDNEKKKYIVEDFKSPITAKKHDFIIKQKLMKAFYNIDVVVVMK
jgi:hypothetical protein